MTKKLIGFFKPTEEDLLWEEGHPPTKSSLEVVDSMIEMLKEDLAKSKAVKAEGRKPK